MGDMRISITHENGQHVVALFIALATSLFLFYIDEGYYNFNYLGKPGNYIPLVIYVSGTWLGQYLVSRLLFRHHKSFDKVLLNAVIGVPLGVTLTILLMLLLRELRA